MVGFARFGGTYVDKDGKINEAELDGSCVEVATLPRRFGLVASWVKGYGAVVRRAAPAMACLTCLISFTAHLVVGFARKVSAAR